MKTTFVVRARSGLGTTLAAVLLSVLLLLAGVWVASNGEIRAVGHALGWGESSVLAKLQAEGAVFKSQGRLVLLVIFGGLVVLLGALVAPAGAFIRTLEFRFDRRRRTLIRRSLWCFLPVWVIGLLLAGVGGAVVWGRGASWVWAAAVCVGYGTLAAVSCWYYPPVSSWGIYLPGFRRQIPLALIKMVEIERGGEGSLALVVRHSSSRREVLGRGRYRRLEKLARWVAGSAGLARQDLLTWF